MLETRPVEDLIRIASAGGGFRLNAALRPTNDLIRIASAASTSGARLYFDGLGMRTTEDLIRIGSAGKGRVSFDAP